jgi:DNA helicase HerA-like ATPase
MIELDISNKSFTILGVKRSGKSTLANQLLLSYGYKALYYDTLGESPIDSPYDSYRPADRYSVIELESVISAVIPPKNSDINKFVPHYELIIIDEANRFCPPKPAPLPPVIAECNDQNRHYHMAFGFIARRPVQLNTDLIELADYIFVFRLTGANDVKYLNNLTRNLGDTVQSLGQYEFVIVNPDKTYQVYNPLKVDKKYLSYVQHEEYRI